jgi:hypothetical protein
MKKLISSLFLVFAILLVSSNSVMAAEFRVAKDDGNITVSENEEVKDLYTGGNLVSINADVEGGLFAGGNVVTIKGDVEKHLMVGGGTVMITGDVDGSVHAGGGTVIIDGAIADDLFVGGGTITISNTASIGGDLVVGGGVVNIQGPVVGNVLLGAGQAIIDSKVGGEVKAEVEALELGENAEIIGDITYKAPKEVVMTEGATVSGEINFDQMSAKKDGTSFKNKVNPKFFAKFISVGIFIKLAVTLATALTLIYLFGKFILKTTNESFSNFWTNLGIGFGAMVLTPILAIVLAMTVVGIWLAGLLMIAYVLMISLSMSLASISLGSWLMKKLTKTSKYEVNWKTVVLGVLAMSLAALIPVVGWLVCFSLMLASLGTLYRLFVKELKIKK